MHGEAIELSALLIQMLSTFLDADRDFHAWRRHPGSNDKVRTDDDLHIVAPGQYCDKRYQISTIAHR